MEERIVTADPVADPQGYQREMVAMLAGRDPATVLEETPEALRKETADLSPGQLQSPPAPGEWSAADLLGHLFDSEIAFAWRARSILAQDRPTLVGYDQNAWANLPRPPFGQLLDAFATLRAANLELIRRTPEAEWERIGEHTERGPISFRVFVQTSAGHDLAHLRQMAQTSAAARGRPGG
jgi:hypothetical protein